MMSTSCGILINRKKVSVEKERRWKTDSSYISEGFVGVERGETTMIFCYIKSEVGLGSLVTFCCCSLRSVSIFWFASFRLLPSEQFELKRSSHIFTIIVSVAILSVIIAFEFFENQTDHHFQFSHIIVFIILGLAMRLFWSHRNNMVKLN